jgi:hypothetical protein
MTTASSSIEDLNKAIEASNPFAIKFVDQHHVWGKSFPDVPSINACASDAVFESIAKVSSGKIDSIGITITAEKGAGKTHLISRIRHQLQAEGKAFFVYMGTYGDLNFIKREFLQTLASSLKKVGSQEVSQWQELAANLLRQIIPNNGYLPKQAVIGVTKKLATDPKLIDRLHNSLLQKKPDVDNPYLLKAILWTLSIPHAPFAVNWLSGQELAEGKATEMGLPNSPNQKQEAESFNFACQILDLISDYCTVVFCFDELDDPDCNTPGATRAQVVFALAKDLRNRIKRCVLLMASFPDTFRDQIKLLPVTGAAYDRTADQVVDLEYLNSESVINLVSQWLERFYQEKDLIPPTLLYPFKEADLVEIGKKRPTARIILKWCFDNWSPGTPPPPVRIAFQNELASLGESISEYMDNKPELAEALRLGFSRIIGQVCENVRIEAVEDIPYKPNEKHYSLDFKVVGIENKESISIGVMVHQISSGNAVQAGLKKLVDYNQLSNNRGCLVRSKTINKRAASAQQHLTDLLAKGGEWVQLNEAHVKPLLAMLFLQRNAKNYDLTDEEIFSFISQRQLVTNNPLIREILSAPSGHEPKGLIDEDKPISTSESISNLDDSGNIDLT